MTYLAPIVPFRIDCVVNGRRSKLLSSNRDNCIWIRFTLAKNADIFFHQIFRLHNVNTQDTLWTINEEKAN